MIIKFIAGALMLFQAISGKKKATDEGNRLKAVVSRRMARAEADEEINLVVDLTKVTWSYNTIRFFYKTYFLPATARVTKGTLKITDEDLHRILLVGNAESFRVQMLCAGTSMTTVARQDVDREEPSDDENDEDSESDSDLEIDYQGTQQAW